MYIKQSGTSRRSAAQKGVLGRRATAMILFPKATEDLLVIFHENKDDPVTAIDKYLQKFGTQCAQKFLTSLTSAPDLFPEDDLLERMREGGQP